MTNIACVDLFCGAGGLTHGLKLQGLNVVAGVDVDEDCRHPFEANNAAKFIKEDVANISSGHLNELFGNSDIRVLAGCAPCQPFSTYAHRYETIGSPRWGLLYHFGRLIREVKPDYVTMENVPSVAKHEVFDDFVDVMQELGYFIHKSIIDCSMYGLPQSRRRMVLLASLHGPIEAVKPTRRTPATVREAIGKIVAIENGQTDPLDPLHTTSKLSNLNLERIQASKPGGTWRDWPENLIAECHRRETGRTYPGVYGRMSWDNPAPTLTTQFYGFGNGRFGHPEQNRAISLREGAILQGFPKTYSFVKEGQPIRFKSLGRMIGNAVPVTLGELIGSTIISHLSSKTIIRNVPSIKNMDIFSQFA
ncbi:DNA cytosine methyltransferase [Rhizobium sp.]|jgi:DNA (cytosine-5)-methyltransferase 1|uniref:DNA cytosine methyltransferase n=1 Tax=Rhizobium sp. TaxID=391 RepID=UPI000E99E1CF|nr:DNA (cytosine-5-)-methyltransferase [Rhizobium sp.]